MRTPHSAEALGYGAGPGPPSQCGGAAGTAGWDFRRSREQPQPAQLIRLPAPVTCCIPEGGEGGGGGGVNKGGGGEDRLPDLLRPRAVAARNLQAPRAISAVPCRLGAPLQSRGLLSPSLPPIP